MIASLILLPAGCWFSLDEVVVIMIRGFGRDVELYVVSIAEEVAILMTDGVAKWENVKVKHRTLGNIFRQESGRGGTVVSVEELVAGRYDLIRRAHRCGVDYRRERRMMGLLRSKADVRPWRMQMLRCLD